MAGFIKEGFRNGNKLTNIMVSIITGLLLIIGFLVRDIYSDFKEMKNLVNKQGTKIEVIEANLINHLSQKAQ